MKNIIVYLLVLLSALKSSYGQQTNTRNYIISRTFKQAGANDNDVSQVNIQVQYIDGLGRPIQNVGIKQSPVGADVITPMAYDDAGRQPRQYLPYVNAVTIGSYRSSATTDVGTWYLANSAGLETATPTTLDLDRPFAETIFELAPTSRASTQQGPGSRSRSGSVTYKVNTGSEVKRYDYVPASNTISSPGNYAAGSLTRNLYTDEQNRLTNEYTDMLGQVICKSVVTAAATLYSYYVYDDLGLLRGVLQPNFQTDNSFTNSAFLYDYDDQARLIKKQIPGGGATEFVYDNFDHPVLSRDANQLARNVWAFTKFDELNRPIMTGELSSNKTRSEWQTKYNAVTVHHENRQGTTGLGYTLNLTSVTAASGFPQVAETDVLTVTYYDDYNFPGATSYAAPSGYPASNSAVKTMATGGRVRRLEGSSAAAGEWLTNTNYYDAEYRPIQAIRDLHDLGAGAVERVSTKYKYDLARAGLPAVVAEQRTEQVVGGTTHFHLAENAYDHGDRLLQVKETVSLSGGAKTKTAYTLAQQYNVLGQLESKWFQGYVTDATKYRRRTTYTNNIRGWMTDAKTSYQQSTAVGLDVNFYAINLTYKNILYAPQYSNGNITTMEWLNKDDTGFTSGLSFTYDEANRLKGSTSLHSYADREDEIAYDLNGNITNLKRYGNAIDVLTYNYSGTGNRLASVTDGSTSNTGVKIGTSSYGYDANGNMTTDGNRGAVLTYNYLNLPKTVVVGGKTLVYDYDAAGTKHKYVADTLIAKYAGIFEYRQVVAANDVVRVGTTTGQMVVSKDTLRLDYFLQDHLGNVRVVFDQTGKIIQNSDYYPFGMSISRDGTLPAAARNGINRHLYNGKELQVGTGFVDYGARMYMPEIGRWGAFDPVTEKMPSSSPYSYSFNNPLRFIDVGGLIPYPITIRSFAPFNTFGGGFQGDGANRGFTTSSNASARVHQRINFDTDKTSISAKAWSSPSSHMFLPGSATETPSVKFSNGLKISSSENSKTFQFGTHSEGANPMVPGSPPIDVFSDFSITENKKAGTLAISGKLTGDNFPSTEAFITDPSGQNAFIGVGMYEGSPLESLGGENKRDITSFNFTITTDKKGNFTGVTMGDKTFKLEDWNKQFEKRDPHKEK